MPFRWVSRLPQALVVLLIGSILGGNLLGLSVVTVRAGHTLPDNQGGGDCWRSNTPLWCHTSWRSGGLLWLTMWNQFTNERPGWYSQYLDACSNWHNFKLPAGGKPDIACHDGTRRTLETLVYVKWDRRTRWRLARRTTAIAMASAARVKTNH